MSNPPLILKTNSLQNIRLPPLMVVLGWLRDDESTAQAQKTRRAFRDDRRGAEGTGCHQVK